MAEISGNQTFSPVTGETNSRLTQTPRNSRAGIAASLYFPQDYQNIFHYVTFTALKFESVTRTSTIQSDQPLVSNRSAQITRQLINITLPMPDQLNTGYEVSYASEPISAVGEVFATGISNVNMQQATEAFRNQRYAEGAQTLAQQLGGGAIAGAAVADIAGAFGSPARTAAIGNVFGFARNPQKVIQFNGVEFRTHQFSFKLTPRNVREANDIHKIIIAFKRHMLPKYGIGETTEQNIRSLIPAGEQAPNIGDFTSQAAATSRAFFEYPDVFKITFNNQKTLFSIGESVLTNFTVDYHPQNYPAYVRSLSSPGVSHPASITVAMAFRETDIVTREQVDEYFR